IHVGIGVHYGPVVLGDIGANRLEFAVIGDAVNVAAKLEAMTRDYRARIVVSDTLKDRALAESPTRHSVMDGFAKRSDQTVRGVVAAMDVWVL
ncbi:MAG: adenylate/guanylate cyclase domain-containing protein, partial [Pseudomonadota bacterium]